jgi:phosphatidylserine/phosphatidylglycerophosphate/cardiolipin synthase-like enzyme
MDRLRPLRTGAGSPPLLRLRGGVYGAYIGSANLTRNGWEKNIEAGLFLNENELGDHGVADQLDLLFGELERISVPLSDELYAKLEILERERKLREAAD